MTESTQLKFGTSGLRGLVRDMTDREVIINTQGFLQYLVAEGRLEPGAPVLLGRDLRDRDPTTGLSSSPRIAQAAARGIAAAGHPVLDAGVVPTPALAAYAMAGADQGRGPLPAVMVTGSHIPADRNGIKFYQPSGEIMKADEAGILAAVTEIRRSRAVKTDATQAEIRETPTAIDEAVRRFYVDRYLRPFRGTSPLSGQRVVIYQHSSAARDIMVDVLSGLGAEVIPLGRRDDFVAVDTEDVTVDDEARYRALVLEHRGNALVSTDGDGDRPLLIDDSGRFHRGDVLGIVCAHRLDAAAAAVPVSATDAIERACKMTVVRTAIGSPYVIEAMNAAVVAGATPVVGWEANGGFMTATPITLNGHPLSALPTRDAVLPIVLTLLTAAEGKKQLSAIFAELPRRATRTGLIDNFPRQVSLAILQMLRPADADISGLRYDDSGVAARRDGAWQSNNDEELRQIKDRVAQHIGVPLALGSVTELNLIDGVRMYFERGDIVHLRPSGNAPQFRVYIVSDEQKRADMLAKAAAGPDGVVTKLALSLHDKSAER